MMKRFTYLAVDSQGNKHSGELDANNRKQALLELSGKHLLALELKITGFDIESPQSTRRLNQRDLLTALFELASMLLAGVPAAEAVASQSSSAAHPAIRVAFGRMLKTLRHGGAFSLALEESRLKIPNFMLFLVRSGELTGAVAPALMDACEQMEYSLQVRAEARNALIYPAILVISGVMAVIMMFVFVVPSFTNLLDQGDQLPWLAWAVLSAGRWANNNILLLVLCMMLFFVVPFFLIKLTFIRHRLLDWLERVPVVGDWLSQADIAAWSRMLASMLKNKVDLMDSLELAGSVVRSPNRRGRLVNAGKTVRQGESLSKALEDNKCLNETGYNLVRVGEKTGSLDKMLLSLSQIYTRQGQQRMKKVLMLIEPIAILLIGGAIGTLIVAIILAITSANDFAF